MTASHEQTSKFLSLVLRHKPDDIGLKLDPQGWANIHALIHCANRHGKRLTEDLLVEIVETSDKRRFVISDDGLRIRANQGHSIPVDLGLVPVAPPDVLYHGTATRFLASIRETGLNPRSRQHVHLSATRATAEVVGARHGVVKVLLIDAKAMHEDGNNFYLSQNGVWLCAEVAPRYISWQED